MTIITEFNQRLASASDVLGFNLAEEDQGSFNWHLARLGVISASNASKAIAKKGSMTRDGYMAVLIGEIATGAPLDGEQPSGKAIEWGNTHEPDARESYSFMSGDVVEQFPFVYANNMRCGCSPDGIVIADSRGVEIKCPFNTRYHIEFICDGRLKKEYMDQVQYSMWITGLNHWEFVSYDPRMKEKVLMHMTIERDEKMMKQFDDAIPQFILEMDRKLEMIGLKFGDQWK